MRAMILEQLRTPLVQREWPDPEPGPGELRVRVLACGVCRTDLHVVDGELAQPRVPIIPGHQIVGRIDKLGSGATGLRLGQRVGIPWLGHTCGVCPYCKAGRENLCDHPLFTGYSRDGGFASLAVADARFAFPLDGAREPGNASELDNAIEPGRSSEWGNASELGRAGELDEAVSLAPLLCAGLIGWRALKLAGPAPRLGLYGFGSAAHLIAQVARWEKREVFAFTRPGDEVTQEFARGLGARWAGGSDERPPEPLDAAIIFATPGPLVPLALQAVRKGGTVVCAGIHMSDIPAFPYRLLWEERRLLSVANLTREDGLEFLRLAPQVGLATKTTRYALADANEALADLRAGKFDGAAVLVM